MRDEIILEVYRIRDQLTEKYNHNLDDVVQAMSIREKRLSRGVRKAKLIKSKMTRVVER